MTSAEFHDILTRALKGRLANGISLKLIKLPEEIARQVEVIRATASIEVSPQNAR